MGECLRLWAVTPQSGPMSAPALADGTVLDLAFRPPCEHRPGAAGGEVSLPLPDAPFMVCMPVPIEGSDHVHVYADNQ